jgi:type IV secretion system protein VirD4
MLLLGRVLAWFLPTVAGFQLATQMLAATWGYHPALGMPWCSFGALRLYAPWQWLVWLWRSQGQSPEVFTWPLRLAASGAVLGLLLSVGLTLWAQRRRVQGETTYGSARWASERDVRRSGLL